MESPYAGLWLRLLRSWGLDQFDPLLALALEAGLFGSLLLIPLSIGVAIVYDRLWDIDIVIRRTLVYGILTASLALMYLVGSQWPRLSLTRSPAKWSSHNSSSLPS